MDFTPGELIAGITSIVGIATTWGALSYRLKSVDDKVDNGRKDQGQRLGHLEDRIAKLEGYLLGARQRKKTRPVGSDEPT